MNFLSPTPKTNGPTWDDVIDKATKPQRRKIRFFRPQFEALGIGPLALTTENLSKIVDSLPENAARDYFRQPTQRNRYAANGLVRALAAIEDAHKLGLPKLTEIPAPQIQGVHWEAIIAKSDKKSHRQILRFFQPHFEERDISSPLWVSDEILVDILEKLPDDAAAQFCKQPDQKNSWAANSFIRALVRIEKAQTLGLPSLKEIPSSYEAGLQERNRFAKKFEPGLRRFFSTYRLPDSLKEEDQFGSIQPTARALAEIGDPIEEGNRDRLTWGLFNAHGYAVEKGYAPQTLAMLYEPTCRVDVIAAAKADGKRGRAVAALRALAGLAHENVELDAWADLSAAATQIENIQTKEAFLDLRDRLEPYTDIERFHLLGKRLVAVARMESYKDLVALQDLTRVSAAIATMVAVSAPASFEIINDSTFSGAPDETGRPSLTSDEHGDLEQALRPELKALIGQFYVLFRRAHGVLPRTLLVGKDGNLRPWALTSVKNVLQRLSDPEDTPADLRFDVGLSPRELRDLGIFRMAWGGDDAETIARAARLSLKYAQDHFGDLINHVHSRRKRGHGK